MSIKERMAALRGAGLNTGGDEPVMPGSSGGPSGRRASVQFGGPPKPAAATTSAVPPSSTQAASSTAGQLNGTAASEPLSESRSPSGRGRKRTDDVVERLERLAMDPATALPAAPAPTSPVPPPSPTKVVAPIPLPAAPPSTTPLQPTQAPPQPEALAPAQQSRQPEIAVSSPSPAAAVADAAPVPPAGPSAVPSRISHAYSASVSSARSGSPSRPPKPAGLSIAPPSAGPVDELSTSAPPALEQGAIGETQNPVAASPLRARTPDADDFSPSKFGHFPSITEFESAAAGEDEPAPAFPSLPSVPLSLPGSAATATAARALPNPPSSPISLQSQAKPQTTGSSVSSFQSTRSAPALSTGTAPAAAPAADAAAGSSGNKAVDFPLANTIFPAKLRQYLALPVELLLLDVRPPQTWASRITPPSTGGGQVDCVTIAPHLLTPSLSSQQLADSLPRTSPFHNRHLYDLVVVYDAASAGWADPNADGARAVNRAVYEREFGGKMLKRAPVLLVGGWDAWRATEEGQAAPPTQPPLKSPGLNGIGAGVNGSREPSPAAKPSYFPLVRPRPASMRPRLPS